MKCRRKLVTAKRVCVKDRSENPFFRGGKCAGEKDCNGEPDANKSLYFAFVCGTPKIVIHKD